MVHPIRNIHVRTLDCPAPAAGALIASLGDREAVLWPSPPWPPVRLDGPLAVGATGGHGPIRYAVTEYEPGRRVRFDFAADFPVDGWHEFRVEPIGETRCRIAHDMIATPRGVMRIGWPVAIRWLHDALLEDLFDNAERVTTGTVRRPNRWSPYVRLLRAALARRPGRRSPAATRPTAAAGRPPG